MGKDIVGRTNNQKVNLTGEYQNGEFLHGYDFNTMNRMEKVWDNTGREAEYQYNGLGQRTGRKTRDIQEDYILDLTRPYHNLLAVKSGEERINYYWDSGVAAMEEKGRVPRYYLQDELGSPLRVLYGTGNGDAYGYDEFGRDMHDPGKEETGRYSRQGGKQPFGYTGYRHDEVSGTYFAQAREYRAELGRFTAEDVVRGNGAVPQTMNRYGYCLTNPMRYIDRNGKEEEECSVYYLNNMDGAKIFGHNALLVEDGDGTSEFYSFMGTGAMPDIFKLSFNALGYMGHESLTKEQTEAFLETGDINVEMPNDTFNQDNYDRALKKIISKEEREQIVQGAQYYVNLYEKYNNKPLIEINDNEYDKAIYNLYSHNCDTVAGEVLSEIDPLFNLCQSGMVNTTPNNSYYVRMALLHDSWEIINIGKNNLFEVSISVPAPYYIDFVSMKTIDDTLKKYLTIALELLVMKGESACVIE